MNSKKQFDGIPTYLWQWTSPEYPEIQPVNLTEMRQQILQLCDEVTLLRKRMDRLQHRFRAKKSRPMPHRI